MEIEIVGWVPVLLTIPCYMYLLYHRSWPPLRMKSLGSAGAYLLCALAGQLILVLNIGPSTAQDSRCLWDYIGYGVVVALYSSALAARMYRTWNIFVRYKINQWTQVQQVSLAMMIYAFPIYPHLVYGLLFPNDLSFSYPDPVSGECPLFDIPGAFWSAWQFIADGSFEPLYLLSTIGLLYGAVKLRGIKAQANESKKTSALLLLFILIIAGFLLSDSVSDWLIWAAVVLNPIMAFWVLLAPSLYHLIKGDEQYLFKYTYGFSTLPSSDELSTSLAEQLKVPVLRDVFAKHAGKRFAMENLEFWDACQALDAIVEREARTATALSIIDRFVRVGAPDEINITGPSRKAVTSSTDVARTDLFNSARQQVYNIMTSDLADWTESSEMSQLKKDIDAEEKLKAAMTAAGIAPGGTPSGQGSTTALFVPIVKDGGGKP